ncbi:peptide chain release factor N(5)-glutamine methyltransferase [Arachnia propionica]|uniref:peptide chain release factor N(5)-glutamine methyltransferase n=1 Tax=Arachnia propionica TaxID=1750 RepID=UPI0030CE53BB
MRAWDLVLEVSEQLAEAGVTTPAADARWLVCHALKCDSAALVLRDASPGDRDKVAGFVARRRTGEPVQHITGWAPFRYETLAVGPGVFIPRPETELLVDEVLGYVTDLPAGKRCVVELCAGSGAIVRSLARECGGLELHAVERSSDAWPWLLRNLEGLGVDCRQEDMSEAFHDLDARVDVVVANPPYVPTSLRGRLPVEVSHDPAEALFGGEDGLDVIRVVHSVARRLLAPGGLVAMEHDQSHADQVREIFSDGFFDIRTVRDLAGHPRHLLARRGRIGG